MAAILQMGEKVKRIKQELFWSSSGKGKKKNKKKEENSFNFCEPADNLDYLNG